MKDLLTLCVMALASVMVLGDVSDSGTLKPPQVYVYTRSPVVYGEKNELICHCTDFHPPRIELLLKNNAKEFENCLLSDMTFKEDWAYYLTKSIPFTPQEGVVYSCDVQHNGGQVKTYVLDPMI